MIKLKPWHLLCTSSSIFLTIELWKTEGPEAKTCMAMPEGQVSGEKCHQHEELKQDDLLIDAVNPPNNARTPAVFLL